MSIFKNPFIRYCTFCALIMYYSGTLRRLATIATAMITGKSGRDMSVTANSLKMLTISLYVWLMVLVFGNWTWTPCHDTCPVTSGLGVSLSLFIFLTSGESGVLGMFWFYLCFSRSLGLSCSLSFCRSLFLSR